MAQQSRLLDVWVIDINQVYAKVPYNVVTDWIQEGRLLETDRIKAPAMNTWVSVAEVPEFAAYLPKATPFQAEDQAEALEPIDAGFGWKPPPSDEDEDVDMIPLIDVSLVLLIFFMMTAAVAGAASLINTPATKEGNRLTQDEQMFWIGIRIGPDRQPDYSIGQGSNGPAQGDKQLSDQEVLQRLDARLPKNSRVDVRIKAEEQVPYKLIKKMTMQMEMRKSPTKGINQVFAEVREANRQ